MHFSPSRRDKLPLEYARGASRSLRMEELWRGEKAWVTQQASWPLFVGRTFPPDEAWESGSQGEVLDHPPRLRVTTTVSKCGI